MVPLAPPDKEGAWSGAGTYPRSCGRQDPQVTTRATPCLPAPTHTLTSQGNQTQCDALPSQPLPGSGRDRGRDPEPYPQLPLSGCRRLTPRRTGQPWALWSVPALSM